MEGYCRGDFCELMQDVNIVPKGIYKILKVIKSGIVCRLIDSEKILIFLPMGSANKIKKINILSKNNNPTLLVDFTKKYNLLRQKIKLSKNFYNPNIDYAYCIFDDASLNEKAANF